MAVARVPGVQRVRLSSVEVIHVRDSLLRALVEEPKVCPHLHVPMQSGDDGVLAAMGRHYTAAEYLEHIARVRGAAPGVNVTTDVIVGFPLEDEAAFERTLATVEAAGITRVHCFPCSPRPGTEAEALGDRVAPEDKKRRSQALRALSEHRSRAHRQARIGRPERVLVDKVADTRCSGYTADYTRCYLENDPARPARRGELVDVSCLELHADGSHCRVRGSASYPESDRMSVTEQVRADITSAMKAGEKARVGALRLVLSELQKAHKEGSDDELAVLRRERKRRLDAASQFRDGGRPELADQEESEAELISGYLPAELDDAELGRLVAAAIEQTGADSPRDMGRVMKAVMDASGGRADGKRTSARVREALGHDRGARTLVRKTIELDNTVAAELAGSEDAVLRSLESHLDCDVYLRGNVLTLDGDAGPVDAAATVVKELSELVGQGHEIAPGTIEAVARALDEHASPSEILEDVVWRHRATKVAPKTVHQKRYVDSIRHNTITFGIGPAGTGKTFLAVAAAAAAAQPARGQPDHPHPPRGRGRRAARLPARRPDGEGRPVPAPAVRRPRTTCSTPSASRSTWSAA